MQKEHIPAVLSTGLFTGYRLCRMLDVADEGTTYSVQYSLKNLEDYNIYKEAHAPRLQQEGLNRFKDKFVAFRTIMEVVE